jgi:hypothetical protein
MGEVFASFRRKGTTKNHSGNSVPLALIGHAAGTRAQGSIVMRARTHDHARGLGYQVGAGEGNRTPTISLGICRIVAVMAADLAGVLSASTRD